MKPYSVAFAKSFALGLAVLLVNAAFVPASSFADVKKASVSVSRQWSEASTTSDSEKQSANSSKNVQDSPTLYGNVRLNPDFPGKDWWRQFNDPQLDAYVNAALQNNPTINIAVHRITQARAMVQQGIATELPSVSIGPSVNRIGLPNNIGNLPLPNTLTFFALPLQASYELDLWGKNLDKIRSAKRQAEASELQSHAAVNMVVGDVVSSYVNLLRTDAMLESERNTEALLKRVAELQQSRYEAGLVAYEEVLRARKAVSEVESSLISLQKQQALFSHQLSILTGSPPAAEANLERATLERLMLPKDTDTGIPSELLARRPDIVAQEKILESASFDVSAARKAFLPTINLSALFAMGGTGFKDMFSWANLINLEGASIGQPLFRGGQLRGELNFRKAKQKEQLEAYHQTILTALKDVEDSLTMLKTGYGELEKAEDKLGLTNQQLALTNDLYTQGLAPKLNVLQLESEKNRYQEAVDQSKADAAIATVSLYKALGGGF